MSKQIRVADDTHERLQERGTAGDTLDDVVRQLLDATEED